MLRSNCRHLGIPRLLGVATGSTKRGMLGVEMYVAA